MNGLQTDAHIAVSWMLQTYPVDKIFMIDSDEDLAEFAKQNPNYFIESQAVIGDDGIPTGMVAAASPNLRLNFDFTPEGQIMDNVEPRTISAKNLFNELDAHDHKSDYIEFVIDGDSMLMPSLEIQKQTFMALFPVITNQITLIFSLRNQDPEAAASQLMALEQLLTIQRQNIYDFISKADYDAIIAKMPSMMQQQMMQQQMAMDAQNTAMQTAAGGGAQEISSPGQQMAGDGTNPLQPQNANEVPRPQSPMGGAVDASVGRAANLPFFPGAPTQ